MTVNQLEGLLLSKTSFLSLTLTAAAFRRASQWILGSPDARSSGWIRSTGHVDVTLAAAAVARDSVVVDGVPVVALQGAWESAGFPRSGRDWRRTERSC